VGRLVSIAATLVVLATAPAALAGPSATLTVGGASVAAPIFAECATTRHPDGTGTGYCADGIPSTEHRVAAAPGSVARVSLSAPVGLGSAVLADPLTRKGATILPLTRVDATTYELVVPILWGPMQLTFGGRWSDGASSGDSAYGAVLVPAAPELVSVGRGRSVVVAMHAGGRVTAELRRGGRLLGRGVRTLTENGEARVPVTLTRAGRRARGRAKLTIVARQVGVEQVTFSRVVRLRPAR
jgi:hypothetical protein